MKREYSTGSAEDITFFTGVEIERTPAYGMKTLFVTGVQPIEAIIGALANQDIHHIFFGANHSFNPNGYEEHKEWEEMITHFLNLDMWCSLDIPMSQVEEFNDGGLNEYDQFIPQIRVPIPYIKLWNYNTMLKVDDKDFKATNPGVWCHNLHDLLDRNKFTSWDQYGNDEIIK
jgi:hypothetical protein